MLPESAATVARPMPDGLHSLSTTSKGLRNRRNTTVYDGGSCLCKHAISSSRCVGAYPSKRALKSPHSLKGADCIQLFTSGDQALFGRQSATRCMKSDHDSSSHVSSQKKMPTGNTPSGSQHWAYRRAPSFNGQQVNVEYVGGHGNSVAAGALAADYQPLQISGAPTAPWTRALQNILVACIAAALFGYHMGIVNGPLGYIARDLGFAGNALLQGLVVSIFLFGAFFGCCISSTVADGLGRRRSLQLSALPILAGTLLSAMAGSAWPMLAGRCLCGAGLGLSIPVMALYVSEISPTAQRGTFGCLSQVSTCFGILLALIASLPLPYIAGWWRACFWFATVPAALLILGMEFCSESPRWLAKKGQWNEAERAVERLWGASQVKSAIFDLRGGSSEEDGKEVRWRDLLSQRYIKVVAIGAAVFGLQQLAGINAIFYFSSTIFNNAGIKSDMAASTVMGIVNLLAALLSTLLMDRLGRKKLMSWSYAGMALSMAIQAVVQALPSLQAIAPAVSVTGTLAYVVAFTMGAGPVPALLLPEIFPSRIRAKAMAVSMCVHWVFNFLIGLTFLPLLKLWGVPVLYSCFAAVCVVAVAFTQGFIIETKGRSLEEIERLLSPDR